MTGSICCIAEIHTTLWTNYTLIKNKIKKRKNVKGWVHLQTRLESFDAIKFSKKGSMNATGQLFNQNTNDRLVHKF